MFSSNIHSDVVTLFMLNVLSSSDVKGWESCLKGAIDQSTALDTRVYYHDPNLKMSVLNNSAGIVFLHEVFQNVQP